MHAQTLGFLKSGWCHEYETKQEQKTSLQEPALHVKHFAKTLIKDDAKSELSLNAELCN